MSPAPSPRPWDDAKGGGMEEEWRRVPLESLMFLLMPADGGRKGAMVQADRHWTFTPPPPDIEQYVWGRFSTLSKNPVFRSTRLAFERELALLRIKLRIPNRFRLVAIHRLPPATLGVGSTRGKLRSVLLGGAVVEMRQGAPVRRVLDAAAEAAGIAGPVSGWRRGSGAAAIAFHRGSDGNSMVLRVARSKSPGDPARAADALTLLESVRIGSVPRILARGSSAGASWTTETFLRGSTPKRVPATIYEDLGRVLSRLPRTGVAPSAPAGDLGVIGGLFPSWAPAMERATAVLDERLRHLPGIMRHGDLWAKNLLIDRDRLAGILDWDAWHESGAPGTDLVYLCVTEQWRRTRRPLGELWARRPWRSLSFKNQTRYYWSTMGLELDEITLEAIGVASWAAQIATNLTRLPQLVYDERWLANGAGKLVSLIESWDATN